MPIQFSGNDRCCTPPHVWVEDNATFGASGLDALLFLQFFNFLNEVFIHFAGGVECLFCRFKPVTSFSTLRIYSITPDLRSIKILHRLNVYAMIGAGFSAGEYDLQTFKFCGAFFEFICVPRRSRCNEFEFHYCAPSFACSSWSLSTWASAAAAGSGASFSINIDRS